MSEFTYQIRAVEKHDLETVYAIDHACFPRGVAYAKSLLKDLLGSPQACGYVVESPAPSVQKGKSGKPTPFGFILAIRYSPRAANIVTLDILEPYRRRGVGTELMKRVEADFRIKPTQVITLEVSVKNTAAQAFYRKLGFEILEKIDNYYENGEDAFEMFKSLEFQRRA
ncbi:MAG: N-acetyltransferase [Acidobacteriia bacterium]|nr:N-acetyltransferase [Terriglobia bacterium]